MRPGAARLAAAIAALPAVAAAAEATAPAPVTAGNLVQVLAGLAVVLALLLGGAFLMRRLGRLPGLANQAIRTVAAASVGTRERVVLLEVSGQWILVGVAPGQVRALATLPKGEIAEAPAGAGAPQGFAQMLQRLRDRRDVR